MIRAITSTEDLPFVRPSLRFVLAEMVLIAAVPVLGVLGLGSLLDSRAGNFVQEPTPADPGWEAFVDPSPVTMVVEMVDGAISGAVIFAQPGEDRTGGALILLPADLMLDGVPLETLRAEDVAVRVGDALDLAIPATEIVDESRWAAISGDQTWLIDNPDPVPDGSGGVLLPVGEVAVGGRDAAPFIGRVAVDAPPASLSVRRQLWWEALVDAPPAGSSEFVRLINAIGNGPHRIDLVPTVVGSVGPELDIEAMEVVLAEVVPFPAGHEPDARLRLRVLARQPDIDIEAEALTLGRSGYEIVRIGNAAVFDDGGSEVLTPLGVEPDERVATLAAQLGATTVTADDGTIEVDLITVLIGTG